MTCKKWVPQYAWWGDAGSLIKENTCCARAGDRAPQGPGLGTSVSSLLKSGSVQFSCRGLCPPGPRPCERPDLFLSCQWEPHSAQPVWLVRFPVGCFTSSGNEILTLSMSSWKQRGLFCPFQAHSGKVSNPHIFMHRCIVSTPSMPGSRREEAFEVFV